MGQNVSIDFALPDVGSWFTEMNNYATQSISGAQQAAQGLSLFVAGIPLSDASFHSIPVDVTMGTPTHPTLAVLPTPTLPNLPSSPTLSDIVIGSAGAVPAFTGSVSVNMPAPPSLFTVTAPIKDYTLDLSVVYPDAPSTDLPAVPSLLSLNIPSPLPLDLPVFNMAFPSASGVYIPSITFSYLENPYSSEVLDAIKAELLFRMNGGTGLNPTVESAIWNRGRDREQRASLLSERTLLVDRASSGFSRPPGSAMAALEVVTQETQSKIIDLSREIMIKQAELEQENLKNAIQQAIALEDILIRHFDVAAQRSFEVAKYTQELAIEICKLAITVYNTEVEAYKSYAIAFETIVKSELAKIEIYKAQLEGQKLISEINDQSIRIYLAQIEGVKTSVSLYTAIIESTTAKLKAEGLKIEAFKAEVDAYGSQVQAEIGIYSMYGEQIKGELAKVQVFDSQVKAFTSQIQAYASTNDIVFKKADVEVKINEYKLGVYTAQLDAYIKQAQANQMVYSEATEVYKAQAEIYLADVGLDKAQAELLLKEAENTITQNKYAADIGIQNAQVTLEAYKSAYMAQLEAKKASGSIYAQLAASALSGINVSASVSGQAQLSESENHNYTGA